MASKFMKSFGNIASIAAPIAGGIFGGPAGAAIGGALGGAVNGKGGLGKAALGAGAGYGGAKLLQGFGIGGGGGTSNLGNIGSSIMGMFGGGGSGGPGGGMTSQQASGLNSYFNPAGGASFGGFGMPSDVSTTSGFGNPLAKFGLLTAGAGLFAGKSPKVPGLPQSAQDYASQVRGGGSQLNQLATSKLTEGLNQPFQQISADEESAALRPIEQQQEQELRQLTGMYKSLRPGTDPTTDTTYQRDLGLLNDRYAKVKGDAVAQLHRQAYNDYQGQQSQRIDQAGQLDAQTQSAMQQVAQWDIDQIATQFGVDYADAAQLKQFLMTEGATLFNSAVDPNQALTSQVLKKYLGVA